MLTQFQLLYTFLLYVVLKFFSGLIRKNNSNLLSIFGSRTINNWLLVTVCININSFAFLHLVINHNICNNKNLQRSMVIKVEKARALPLIQTSITSSAPAGKSPLVVVHWLFPPRQRETKINRTKQIKNQEEVPKLA